MIEKMEPMTVMLLAAAGAALVLSGKQSSMASDAPADANSWLATVLAPSMTDIAQLQQFLQYFIAGSKAAKTVRTQVRLGLYALVTQLKIALPQRGAQPNADELAAISQVPTSGIGGIQQLPDASADAQQAAYAALVDSQQDPKVIRQYLAAINAASSNSELTMAQTLRLYQYATALAAKALALESGIPFTAGIYFAIANATMKDTAPYSAQNSITKVM